MSEVIQAAQTVTQHPNRTSMQTIRKPFYLQAVKVSFRIFFHFAQRMMIKCLFTTPALLRWLYEYTKVRPKQAIWNETIHTIREDKTKAFDSYPFCSSMEDVKAYFRACCCEALRKDGDDIQEWTKSQEDIANVLGGEAFSAAKLYQQKNTPEENKKEKQNNSSGPNAKHSGEDTGM